MTAPLAFSLFADPWGAPRDYEPLHAEPVEAGVDRHRVLLDQMAQHGADSGVNRIVFCGRTQPNAINKQKKNLPPSAIPPGQRP